MILLILSYLLSVVVVFSALLYWSGETDSRFQWVLLGISVGAGPAFLSWANAVLLLLFVGGESGTYQLIILGGLFILAVLSSPVLLKAKVFSAHVTKDSVAEMLKSRPEIWFLFILIATVAGATLLFPLYGNDPLEYAQVARLVYEYKDFSIYPIVNSGIGKGFYGPWTHPPGYMSLQVWSYFLQGHSDFPGLARFPAFYFACATVLLILATVRGRAGLLSAVFLLSVPIYFSTLATSHIDPMRVFFVFAVFVYLKELSFELSNGRVLICGLLAGFGLFSHSIGILIIPLLAAAIVFLGTKGLTNRVLSSVGISLIAVLVVAPFYYGNYVSFGRLVSDSPPVWEIAELAVNTHMEHVRGLDGMAHKISYGVFKGLTRLTSFGLSYWAFIIALGLLLHQTIQRTNKKPLTSSVSGDDDWIRLCLLIIGLYFTMTIVATFMGMNSFIKNDRYPLTIQPFVAIFSGIVFMRLIVRWSK